MSLFKRCRDAATHSRASFVFLWLATAMLLGSAAHSATLPSGFAETRVATGLASPTAMSLAPDGRLFICEQGGKLRIVKNGALLSTPFLTLSVNSSGERGLLGVAFDPNFASNSFIYVYYTTSGSPIHNRVSRFTASGGNPDVVAAGSEVQLLNLPSLSSATNHNGGAIHFGTDGKLYISVGDNANSANSNPLTTTLGKFLRINADGTIPSDNPFVSQTSGINQAIWGRGLRNPFNFAVDRTTGRIHLNDVGQDSWEEVNHAIAGANFGWPQTEGPNPSGVSGVRYPVHTYENAGSNCAIVGASFYRPTTSNFPAEYTGRYFFGDFCGGFIRMLSPPNYSTSAGFATGISSLVDIQTAADGSLYYLARGGGDVFRVRYTANSAPSITSQPANRTVSAGQSASFTVAASGTAPMRYQWQRNGANISGGHVHDIHIADHCCSRHWRHVPRRCEQRLRLREQQLGDADGVDQQRTDRLDQLTDRRYAIPGRADLHVCRYGIGCRRRHVASERLHLASGLPSRRSHASACCSDQRSYDRHLQDRGPG